MLPSHRNQSVDLLANQLTGVYMMETLIFKRLMQIIVQRCILTFGLVTKFYELIIDKLQIITKIQNKSIL